MDGDLDPLALPPLTARPHEGSARVRLPLGARLRDELTTYLPLVIMAVLAGASWWLIQNTPEAATERVRSPVLHEPDYEMQGFSVQHYTVAGPAKGVIEGDVVRHYPDTDELVIDGVRLRWADDQGHLMHASAARAVASGDGRRVRLEGGARVRRDAIDGVSTEMEFTSEVMEFDSDAATVDSAEPIVLREGDTTLRAATLHYQHRDGLLTLGGPVHGVVPARHPGVTGRR
jgi:lipopolysaccharide export system protein LptC